MFVKAYHAVVVKDKYGDIDLDNVADESSDSSSSEHEEAMVFCWTLLVLWCVYWPLAAVHLVE